MDRERRDFFRKRYPLKAKRNMEIPALIFMLSQKNAGAFIEVKGVTLEEENVVRFPDAPHTQRLKACGRTYGMRKGWL